MIVIKKGRDASKVAYVVGQSKGVEKTYKLSDAMVDWFKANNIDVGDEITNDTSDENKGFIKDDAGVITLTKLILVNKANHNNALPAETPTQVVDTVKETNSTSKEEITFLIEAMEDLLGKLKSTLSNKLGA